MIATRGRADRSRSAKSSGSVVIWIVRAPTMLARSATGPPSESASQVGTDDDAIAGPWGADANESSTAR